MKKAKIQSHPPRPPQPDVKDELLQKFIEGAETPREAKQTKELISHPWESRNVRNDVKKLFSLRLTEPYMLKLKYLQAKTGKSMHQFCLEKLLPEIDKAINELE